MAEGRWVGFPRSWGDVMVRTIKVLITAFLVLVLKEYMDTHEWDIQACAIDASWVAGGTLVLNALLKVIGR